MEKALLLGSTSARGGQSMEIRQDVSSWGKVCSAVTRAQNWNWELWFGSFIYSSVAVGKLPVSASLVAPL